MTSVIIPFRDRAEHLSILAPRLAQVLPDAEILVIEQAPGKPFNRAKLLNVGALNAKGDYFIFHDVDMVPLYPYPPPIIGGITQVASSNIQFHDYLGGVTVFEKGIFEKSGGYNNEYFHRAEDNEMMFNLQRLKLPVHYRFVRFEILPHTRNGVEFDPKLWVKAQQQRTVQNQLMACEYEITDAQENEVYKKYTICL